MSRDEPVGFNRILDKMIEKSLFTKRQIEIILNHRRIVESEFPISRGAYYRQVEQSRAKLVGFYYTVVLLRGLKILEPGEIEAVLKLGEQVNVIKDSDIFPEREDEVMQIIEQFIKQATKM